MRRPHLLAGLALLLVAALPDPAGAAGFRLTDDEGVTYFTNAPTDPRYRRLTGWSGTTAGWLRLPEPTRLRFAEEIREIAGRQGVPARLVEAVIRVESSFNPRAVSRKGAQGLMQLMPQTAAALGVRDAFDPRQNIEGGVRHLRALLDRWPLPLALAAYNAGEGAVTAYRGVPPYAETQQYVRRILELHGEGGVAPAVYRYEEPDGTVIYTNVPPAPGVRLR